MLEETMKETVVENPIRQRVAGFKDADRVRAIGLYPYFRPISSAQDTEVMLEGQQVLMFGSNSYMGLTNHPKVKEAAVAAVKKYGTGCAGSRFLNGTLDLHLECEAKLAQFVGKEGALLYSTGFQVNQGVIACLLGRADCVILDKSDHASIVEGANLSLGKVARFRHNDLAGLRHVLESNAASGGKLIVVDGVYSMEGDIAPLPEIVALAQEFDALLMVDDAHGIGVLGPQGRGTSAHFGLTDKVDLIMGTFSKSLASLGGFIASDAVMIEYLKHHSRALIFSASLPPSNVAAVIAALEIMQAEPERIEALWNNTRRMTDGLRGLGFDTGHSATPIIPVLIGDDLLCFKACRMLQEEGVFVNPVVSPAVEPGHTLIRVSLMASHTFAQIDIALEKFALVGRALGLIP
ncbi:MAG: pyridoxal phosphate-dependent aminotransferase family protein [Kiritimatiellaeota bacterium]|nr:pyridoxal phosphate-dependent aminotransferase family protein [Kiritimatiellota bacterium]